MTKFTKILAAVAMLWLAVVQATPLMAQQYDFQVGQLYYKITNPAKREVAVVPQYRNGSYDIKPTGAITIPDIVSNGTRAYSVTSIGKEAFSSCSRLTSIDIPSSVTSIGESAFSRCSGLTSITIPNSVTSIGERVFSGCSGLTSITIPNSVTSIGESAFSDCSGLTSIAIPNSVTSIGKEAFSECSGLTSINIPNSVTSIEYMAFYGCTSLTSINIPSSVTHIEYMVFYGCTSLTSINIPNSVRSIGESAFSRCSGLTSINIPNSVTSIGWKAFSYCSGLTSINIPNSVTSIGKEAFSYCSGLTSINIPSSITSIEDRTFYGCSVLTSINIPNSVTSIEWQAFGGCSGLTSINIPSSVTSIEYMAFAVCTGLTAVVVGWQTPLQVDSNVFDGVTLNSVRLIVPAGRESIYRAADVWKRFNPIVETANYTITYNQPANGTLTVKNGWQTIHSGDSAEYGIVLTIEATPAQYYKLDSIRVNGIRTSGFSFTVDSNTMVEAYFSKMKYTVTYTQPANGTLTLKNGSQTILSGDSVEYGTVLTVETIPSQGYRLDRLSINGERIVGLSFMVQGNTTVEVIFGRDGYNVIYNQSEGGTFRILSDLQEIIVSGDMVDKGKTLTIEVTPAQHYKFDSIKVNNIRLEGFSFIVEENSTVEVYFSKMKYTVTYTQPANGMFMVEDGWSPVSSGSSVEYGKVLTVNATPSHGYKLDSVRVNGTRISGLSFTVNDNITVEVFFGKKKHLVIYTQPIGGTFKVKNGSQEVASGGGVNDGTVLTIEATPAQGYRLDSVRVNGVRISGLSFTVTSSSVVEVYFSKPLFTISYNLSAGGTFKVKNGSQEVASGSTVEYGTVLTVEATPAQGYKFDSIRVNGARISGLSFTVTENTNIEVFFGKQRYAVTYNNPFGGNIQVTKGTDIVVSGENVEEDTELIVRATPDSGFVLNSLTLNGQDIGNGYTFRIDKAVDIKAVFTATTTALDEAATKPLAIYPNPVAEVLYLSATARTIRIYDMYGTEVAHATDTDKVEVSHLPAGIYTVRADGMVTKMIKR